MRKILSFVVIIFALCNLLPAFGQEPNSNIVGEIVKYTVQPGDNLWELSATKLHDPRVWTTLVRDNTFLQEKGRMFQRGDKTVVLLRPGEKLVGLEQLGLLPELLPITALQVPASVVRSASTLTSTTAIPETRNSFSAWWWVFTILGVLAVLCLLVIVRGMHMARARAAALARNSSDPVYQSRGMRSHLRVVLGMPITTGEMRRAAVASFDATNALREEGLRGKLSEIVESTVTGGSVLTEYRRTYLDSLPQGDRVFLGVFRDDRGNIININLHFKYCLNGLLLSQMTAQQIRTFLSESRFLDNKRIWNSADYRRPFNWTEIRVWMNDNLARMSSEATTTSTPATEEIAEEVAPEPSVPHLVAMADRAQQNQSFLTLHGEVRIIGPCQVGTVNGNTYIVTTSQEVDVSRIADHRGGAH